MESPYFKNWNPTQAQATVIVSNGQPIKAIKKLIFKHSEAKLKIWTAAKNLSKTVLGQSELLSDLRKNCTVKRVDIQLLEPLACGKNILKAIDRIVKNGLFIDWLLLKCEAANIPYLDVHDHISVYSTQDIESLKVLIHQESCLPLPFIYKKSQSSMYFFVSFNLRGNSKSEKLNSQVFFDASKKEVLVSLDLGIRLRRGYEQRVENFKIFVPDSLEPYVKEHLTEIKRLIVYNHILWGFLQDWVRNMSTNVFQKTFSTKQVASNLWLHRIEMSKIKDLNDIDNTFLVASFADFALYLRFGTTFNGNYFVFMIENIETPIVCTDFVIQYYKQFFYINDVTKSNALRCLLDYSQSKKTFLELENVYEYKMNEKKSQVEKPLLKTKTVEEINASVGEINKDQANEESIVKLIKSGAIDKEQVKNILMPFVKERLRACFEKNSIEIVNHDESDDVSVMVHRFEDAISRADRNGSFQMFLEYVYNSLQMHFTNATCQKIMECMVYKDLENRYSDPNGLLEESVGGKKLEELFCKEKEPENEVRDEEVVEEPENVVSDEEGNKGVKRKGETAEEDPSPKMPKLMPVWEFLKKEREKDLGSKYACKLRTCSVVLAKMDYRKLNEKVQELRKGDTSPQGNKENSFHENRSTPKPVEENLNDIRKSPRCSPKRSEENLNRRSPRSQGKNINETESSPKLTGEKNLSENRSPKTGEEKSLNDSRSSPKASEEKNLNKTGNSSKAGSEIRSSPKASEEKNLNKTGNSSKADSDTPVPDENRNNTRAANFMLKFPKIFLKSKSRKSSKCESDKSESTHESDEEPQRKSQEFWEEEKLYRACLTTKAVVVLNRCEEVVGVSHVQNKNVKMARNDKKDIKSEPLSPKHNPDGQQELGMKIEPKVERRSVSVQVEEPEERVSNEKNDKTDNLTVLDIADTLQEMVAMGTRPSTPPEDELEIVEVIEPIRPKKDSKKRCQRCMAEFNTFKEIEEHEKSAHANDKIYSCHFEGCPKKFYAFPYLELHIKTKHEKNLNCRYCHLTLRNVDELEKHLESDEHTRKRTSFVEEL